MFSKDNGKLVHFDSFGGYNSRHAVALQMKIGSHLKRMYSLLYLFDIFLSHRMEQRYQGKSILEKRCQHH